MKKYLLIFTVLILSSNLKAGIADSLFFGFAGGYNNHSKIQGEMYFMKDLTIFKKHGEFKLGMNTRSYQLTFDNLDLDANSIGFFGDLSVYPFNKGLFVGLRWESINFNWLTYESKAEIEMKKNYSPTSLYTGTCMLIPIGYNLNISDNFRIKLYGLPGLQQFKITNGSSSSGNYVQAGTNSNLIIEDHYEFIFNVNLSIEFSLSY